MLTLKKILLATDFSDTAEERVEYAFELARRSRAELHVLYADVLHGEPYVELESRPATEEAALAEIDRLTAKAAERYEVRLKKTVERNVTPAPAILDYAAEHDVDLIIVGTHGRRGVRRLVLGSVAEDVLRLAKCPVLAIRPVKREDAARPKIGVLESILVPIDFSTHSADALAYAKELAALFGARLDLLHVVEETLHPAFYGIAVQSIYDVQPDIEEKSIEHMMEMFAKTEGPKVEVAYAARPGSAAAEIVDYAEERGCGLIVMGTHGLTGLEHFLMGSTTERVLRRSPAPVFAVKSFGKSLIEGTARKPEMAAV